MTNILAKKWIEPLGGREWGTWYKPSALPSMLGQDCIVSIGANLPGPSPAFQCVIEARESSTAPAQRIKFVETPALATGTFRLDLADLPVAAGTEWRVSLLTGEPETLELYSSYLPL